MPLLVPVTVEDAETRQSALYFPAVLAAQAPVSLNAARTGRPIFVSTQGPGQYEFDLKFRSRAYRFCYLQSQVYLESTLANAGGDRFSQIHRGNIALTINANGTPQDVNLPIADDFTAPVFLGGNVNFLSFSPLIQGDAPPVSAGWASVVLPTVVEQMLLRIRVRLIFSDDRL